MMTAAGADQGMDKGESCRAKVQQIRQAARKLFMENGYRCTSMDQIAQLADVSKTTLYAYFASKEALFIAMVQAEKARLGMFVPSEIPEGAVDARAVLLGVANGIVSLMCDQTLMGTFRSVLAESSHSPQLAEAMWEEGPSKITRQITHLMGQLAERGSLSVDDPATAARHFLALVRGDWHLHTLMDSRFVADRAELDGHIEKALDFFLAHYR
jgi:TetR/AcrR family transcriptional repressor of mexJK operon